MLQMLMSDKAGGINVAILRVKTNSLLLKQLEQTESGRGHISGPHLTEAGSTEGKTVEGIAQTSQMCKKQPVGEEE